MSAGDEALRALAEELRADGGLLADAVVDPPDGSALPAGERQAEVGVLLEAIREGYLLHYAAGRVLAPADPDLALLGGDRLYALGLERLAMLGDLDAVRALADVIADSARAHAEGRPDDAAGAWSVGEQRVRRATTP